MIQVLYLFYQVLHELYCMFIMVATYDPNIEGFTVVATTTTVVV